MADGLLVAECVKLPFVFVPFITPVMLDEAEAMDDIDIVDVVMLPVMLLPADIIKEGLLPAATDDIVLGYEPTPEAGILSGGADDDVLIELPLSAGAEEVELEQGMLTPYAEHAVLPHVQAAEQLINTLFIQSAYVSPYLVDQQHLNM